MNTCSYLFEIFVSEYHYCCRYLFLSSHHDFYPYHWTCTNSIEFYFENKTITLEPDIPKTSLLVAGFFGWHFILVCSYRI